MATATSTINVIQQNGYDPLVLSNTLSPGSFRSRLRKFTRLLTSIASGVRKTTAVTYGTAAASKAVTLVTAVVGNKLTLNGADLTAAQLHARATATFSTIVADNVVTLNGIAFTAKASPAAGSLVQFALGASDTAAAANLATLVNAHPSLIGVITATSALGVVTFRAVTYGTAGNAYTLTKTGGPITVTGSGFLASGAAPTGDQWDYGDTDTQGAASLAACIVRSATALIANHVTATSALGVVTVTAKRKDTSGNAVTIAKTGAPLTIAGGAARLSGGTETTVSL